MRRDGVENKDLLERDGEGKGEGDGEGERGRGRGERGVGERG